MYHLSGVCFVLTPPQEQNLVWVQVFVLFFFQYLIDLFYFLKILFYYLTSQYCIGVATYQHESATGIRFHTVVTVYMLSLLS